MKLAANYALSTRVRRVFFKFGADVSVASRRRDIATSHDGGASQRCTHHVRSRGTSGSTRRNQELALMTLFVLGHGAPIKEMFDPRQDESGALLQAEKLPKPVRPKREPQPK